MKRLLSLSLILCLVMAMFSGCDFGQDIITLNVYNWGEYISDGSDDLMDVNAEFERRFGVRVNYKTYESNESMYTLLESGAAEYDVVIPSDYMIGKMINQGMLAELNFDNIPIIAIFTISIKTWTTIPITNIPFPIPGARWVSSTTKNT